MVTQGTSTDPRVLLQWGKPGSLLCSSYQCEIIAIIEALTWFQTTDMQSARICTDSLSCMETITGSWNCKDYYDHKLITLIRNITTHKNIHFIWVPAHCGIPGNELADNVAKTATTEIQQGVPWSYDTAKSRIKAYYKAWNIEHERSKSIYANTIKHEEEAKMSREDQVLLTRLRTGHCPVFRDYRKKIDQTAEALCRKCGDEDESPLHVITKCPAIQYKRLELFGSYTCPPP